MAQPRFSVDGLAVSVVLGALIAFALLKAWMWSAQFPSSSDGRVLAIPMVVVLTGLVAVAALIIRLVWRRE